MLDLYSLAADPDLDFPQPPPPAAAAEPLALLGYEDCRAAGATWAESMQPLVIGAQRHHTSHIRVRDVPPRLALHGVEHEDPGTEGPTPVPESVEEQEALAEPCCDTQPHAGKAGRTRTHSPTRAGR